MTAPASQLEVVSAGAAYLRISGADATRWLNGMVTNNIKDLAPGESNYNFLLNAQGRIQGDCTLHREPHDGEPTYLLVTDAFQIDTLQQHLDKFIIMDEVELQRVPATDPGLSFLHADAELPPETREAQRILAGVPRFGTDIRNTDLPQETALDGGQSRALNFNKGCYLGQEIVERIHSRGQVHRTFTRFTLTGTLPTLPAPLASDGKPAGELTSAMQIGDTLHALGYLRREFLSAPLTYAGGTAHPLKPIP